MSEIGTDFAAACSLWPILLTHVKFAPLSGDHVHSRMLYGCGAVALLGFENFVGHPLAVNITGGYFLPLILQQHMVSNLQVFRICIKYYWKSKQWADLQVMRSHRLVDPPILLELCRD